MGFRHVAIPARDGFNLGGTVFEAEASRGVVLVNCATAVPHRFYGRFGEAPAQVGADRIGHMVFFRPGAKRLWSETIDWLSP